MAGGGVDGVRVFGVAGVDVDVATGGLGGGVGGVTSDPRGALGIRMGGGSGATATTTSIRVPRGTRTSARGDCLVIDPGVASDS